MERNVWKWAGEGKRKRINEERLIRKRKTDKHHLKYQQARSPHFNIIQLSDWELYHCPFHSFRHFQIFLFVSLSLSNSPVYHEFIFFLFLIFKNSSLCVINFHFLLPFEKYSTSVTFTFTFNHGYLNILPYYSFTLFLFRIFEHSCLLLF